MIIDSYQALNRETNRSSKSKEKTKTCVLVHNTVQRHRSCTQHTNNELHIHLWPPKKAWLTSSCYTAHYKNVSSQLLWPPPLYLASCCQMKHTQEWSQRSSLSYTNNHRQHTKHRVQHFSPYLLLKPTLVYLRWLSFMANLLWRANHVV